MTRMVTRTRIVILSGRASFVCMGTLSDNIDGIFDLHRPPHQRHPEGPRFLQRAEGSPHDLLWQVCTRSASLWRGPPSADHRPDERNLLAAAPAFDFLFACNSSVGINE